jgi:hypothetical protein
VLLVGLAGCATMIPVTDDVPPRLELAVRGPGIGRQVMTNPPRETWSGPGGAQLFDLQRDTTYDFTFVVSDSGGVARAHLRMPAELEVSGLTPAAATNTADGLQRRLVLAGDRADPRTGLVISGSFRTPRSGVVAFRFQAEGDDFGGTAARTNQRFLNVDAAYGAN